MKMYDLNPNEASNLQQNDEMGGVFCDVRVGGPGYWGGFQDNFGKRVGQAAAIL